MTHRNPAPTVPASTTLAVGLCLLLAGTPGSVAAQDDAVQQATGSCSAEPGVRYLCGPSNAEDIRRIGASPWLLASGMAGAGVNGRLHLIDIRNGKWDVLFPGPSAQVRHDRTLFPDCPGTLDDSALSLHGLALQNHPAGSDTYRLYLTSHGTREAIEVFTLTAAGTPLLQWIGCVPLPSTVWANSVEILPDGGFLATNFMDPSGAGFQAVLAGELNGQVLEWHPGGSVQAVAGTELSGPNGIALSDDGRWLYVAAFGSAELVRFDLDSSPPARTEISLGVVPDNLRWTRDGRLLTAGGNIDGACFDSAGAPCGPGWSVVEFDPATLAVRRLGGLPATAAMSSASTALLVGAELWVGTPRGDRIAVLPLPDSTP